MIPEVMMNNVAYIEAWKRNKENEGRGRFSANQSGLEFIHNEHGLDWEKEWNRDWEIRDGLYWLINK